MVCFDPVHFGRQRLTTRTGVQRHRHEESYLALVIDGGYEESGDRGRHHVAAGDVVMHGGFEAHLNRYDRSRSQVLNIALPTWMEPEHAVMQISDPDTAVRLAERDPREAAAFLFYAMKPRRMRLADWPDELAAALTVDPNMRLQDWARLRGLADATVSRGFRKVFGISPSAYRAQVRGRQAWRRVVEGAHSLASIAFDSGFSDQAHMTRTIRALTGRPPGQWRGQVK
jgi:AraC-like DNA-binding protein